MHCVCTQEKHIVSKNRNILSASSGSSQVVMHKHLRTLLYVHFAAVVDPGFGKRGFMHMCTVAATPPFDAHAHRCNESGLLLF